MEKLDSKQMMQKLNCPICARDSKVIDTLKTMNAHSDDEVSLRECLDCKHWWISPIPDQKYLSALYQEGSKFVVSENYHGTSPTDVDCKNFYDRLVDLWGGKIFNYLEIGCGTGSLLKYFSKTAKISFGVEPGIWAKGENIVADINDLPKDILFDVVVIGGTLEHVVDVGQMISQINKLAHKGAIIYVDMPNKDCLKAKLMKGKWSMVLPVGHLHFFSSQSIDILFKDFEILSKKKLRQGGLGPIDLVRGFDLKSKNIIFRLFKSLILGQIILGKDQWEVIFRK